MSWPRGRRGAATREPGVLVTPAAATHATASTHAAPVLLLPLLHLAVGVGLMGRRIEHAALRGVRFRINFTAADAGQSNQRDQGRPERLRVPHLAIHRSIPAGTLYNR